MNWVTISINGQEVSVAFDQNSIHIYNAFPIKDDLKLRGYRWNPADKSWFITPGNIDDEMSQLKNNLQKPPKPAPIQKEEQEKTPLAQFPDSYSVSDLRNRLDRLIRDGIRGHLWIRGIVASEIKNYKWASYLDLKDEDESKDILFRMEIKPANLEKINRKLKDAGIAETLERDLPIFCNVEIYLPLRNVVDIRLNVLDILPEYTQSKIRNQREITLEKLKEEGILTNQKQLLLPMLISNIGLITSNQGTSLQDISAGLHPLENKYRLYFLDSRMEGPHAVDNIIQAISYFEENPDIPIDAIIIARGGGSEQSLSVFNDLRLCRKVCLCPIPIITAVGHEKDVSAIELCSWFTPTPSTPSGIGKYLQNRYMSLQDQLASIISRLISYFSNTHQREMEKLRAFLKNVPPRVQSYLQWREERLRSLNKGLAKSLRFAVRHHEQRIHHLTGQLIRKSLDLRLKNRHNIRNLTAVVRARILSLHHRERKQIEKTILRLDLKKQQRKNRQLLELLRDKARYLMDSSSKKILETDKNLQNYRDLVRASDPQNILKKGFTLTLDEENHVIKTAKQFHQRHTDTATLRFFDGTVSIRKNQDNREEKS